MLIIFDIIENTEQEPGRLIGPGSIQINLIKPIIGRLDQKAVAMAALAPIGLMGTLGKSPILPCGNHPGDLDASIAPDELFRISAVAIQHYFYRLRYKQCRQIIEHDSAQGKSFIGLQAKTHFAINKKRKA